MRRLVAVVAAAIALLSWGETRGQSFIPVASGIVPNTVAYWRFDDANLGATIADSSGRGHNMVRHMLPAASTLDFAIGGNEAGQQLTTARLAKWGIWYRILTPTELAALAGGEGWPFTTTTSLQDAKAYYLLNEASSSTTYADATGRGNTLTKHGTDATIQVAGPLGSDKATQFDGTNWLARAATADLAPGNITHTIVGWANMDALGATQQTWWGQFNQGIRTGDVVYYHEIYGWINWDFGNDVDLFRNAVTMTSNYGHPTTGVWYFNVCAYDQSAGVNAMSQSLNGSTYNVLANIQQPAQVVGKVGGGLGAKFQVNPNGNTTQLTGWDQVGDAGFASLPPTADLQFGNKPKTVWGWVKMSDTSTTQTVMGFFSTPSNNIDWVIQQSGGALAFLLGDGVSHFDDVTLPIGDTTTWHLFVFWYDPLGDGKIHGDLDHGAHVATPVAPTHRPATNNLNFMMGAATAPGTSSGFAQQFKGTLDGVGISATVPTQADLDFLWNGGNGVDL